MMVKVQGRCPRGCGETLFLGDGGYVTCSWVRCPEPDAASKLLERLAAEQEAAQAASSEPDETERGVGTDMPCEPSQPDPSSPVAPGALSGSLGAEAENWCYYTWPANAGSSKGRTAAFEAVNLGSSPSPAVSLGAEADATLREAAEGFEQIAGCTPHVRGCDEPDDPHCARCIADSEAARAREALDRLLAGKAAV